MNLLDTISFLPDCIAPAGNGSGAERIFKAYAVGGARHMVLSHPLCRRFLEEPPFLRSLLGKMTELQLDFRDCHAPYGVDFDFNGVCSALEKHHRLMALCGELGVKTYTVHLGPLYGDQTIPQALSQARRAAERLLPWAEDADIVLCVENIYYPTTTVENLLALLRDFPSPHFGFCFDSGHANVMTYGVRNRILCDWVRAYWEACGIQPPCEDFTPLWPYLATCHLHDNPGDSDAHMPPGWEGCTVDWPGLFARLRKAPRLVSMQTEVHAACYEHTAAELVASFRSVFPG